MAPAANASNGFAERLVSEISRSSPSRQSQTAISRPAPTRTPKFARRWRSAFPTASVCAPIFSSAPTPTATAAAWPCQTAKTPTVFLPETRSACCCSISSARRGNRTGPCRKIPLPSPPSSPPTWQTPSPRTTAWSFAAPSQASNSSANKSAFSNRRAIRSAFSSALKRATAISLAATCATKTV